MQPRLCSRHATDGTAHERTNTMPATSVKSIGRTNPFEGVSVCCRVLCSVRKEISPQVSIGAVQTSDDGADSELTAED